MTTDNASKKNTTTDDGRATFITDASTGTRVIESIVLRGDLSGLGPTERAKFYTQMCEGLGLVCADVTAGRRYGIECTVWIIGRAAPKGGA